jgi:hypothetical protein
MVGVHPGMRKQFWRKSACIEKSSQQRVAANAVA